MHTIREALVLATLRAKNENAYAVVLVRTALQNAVYQRYTDKKQ